jgi:cytoskeletal protein CcmA (bactofilin family)
MWKSSADDPVREGGTPAERPERVPKSGSSKLATLGPSLLIQGSLSGEEDLLIEGRVEGEISLRKHSVTVGPKGRIQADIYSKSISVEGEVAGNLFGEDQVVIRSTGKVRGNITSPRVSLEDGSRFKGAIDMKVPAVKGDGPQVPPSDSPPSTKSGGRAAEAGRTEETAKSPGQTARAGG